MRETIEALRQLGYQLSLGEDGIHYKFTGSQKPDKERVFSLFTEIRAHKEEAIAYLKAEEGPNTRKPARDFFRPLKLLESLPEGYRPNLARIIHQQQQAQLDEKEFGALAALLVSGEADSLVPLFISPAERIVDVELFLEMNLKNLYHPLWRPIALANLRAFKKAWEARQRGAKGGTRDEQENSSG